MLDRPDPCSPPPVSAAVRSLKRLPCCDRRRRHTTTVYPGLCRCDSIPLALILAALDAARRAIRSVRNFDSLDQALDPHAVAAATGCACQIARKSGSVGTGHPALDGKDHAHHLRLRSEGNAQAPRLRHLAVSALVQTDLLYCFLERRVRRPGYGVRLRQMIQKAAANPTTPSRYSGGSRSDAGSS